MTIIAKKIDAKFGNRYKASEELGIKYANINYWYNKNPKEMSSKLIEKIAKALDINSDELRKEIINN